MKINKEVAKSLIDHYVVQLRKYKINIGYYHQGHNHIVITRKDSYIICVTCDFDIIGRITKEYYWLIENPNFSEEEESGWVTMFSNTPRFDLEKVDLHQRTKQIDDFLIDLFVWERDGYLKKYEFMTCIVTPDLKYLWRPTGNGQVEIQIHSVNGMQTRIMSFSEIGDPILKTHINNNIGNICSS